MIYQDVLEHGFLRFEFEAEGRERVAQADVAGIVGAREQEVFLLRPTVDHRHIGEHWPRLSIELNRFPKRSIERPAPQSLGCAPRFKLRIAASWRLSGG
jgi:hypothetical protein